MEQYQDEDVTQVDNTAPIMVDSTTTLPAPAGDLRGWLRSPAPPLPIPWFGLAVILVALLPVVGWLALGAGADESGERVRTAHAPGDRTSAVAEDDTRDTHVTRTPAEGPASGDVVESEVAGVTGPTGDPASVEDEVASTTTALTTAPAPAVEPEPATSTTAPPAPCMDACPQPPECGDSYLWPDGLWHCSPPPCPDGSRPPCMPTPPSTVPPSGDDS